MVESVIAGRYRLERRIGDGGMSEVWAATDLELDRTVAVKLLAEDADPARFDREARAAAGLAHANICALYDYGRAEGRRFMVLEYLAGGSLEERLAAGRPLPDDETRRIAEEVAAGLAHAHGRGVVHRDLKPANILFDAEGRAKIADFGIARTSDATGLTEAGTVLGTAAYISPEQAAGRPAAPASDVYAFGVILFRMLTGRLPFESPDALALAAMHRDLHAPPVSDFRTDAPALLESVAAAALAKSPADRPADGTALAAELSAGTTATGSTAVTQVIAPAPSPRRRRRWVLPLAVALLAAAGVGLAMAVTLGNGSTTEPTSTTRSTTQTTDHTTTAPAFTEPTTEATSVTNPTTAPTTPAPTTGETTTAPTTSSVPATTETTEPTTLPVTTTPPVTETPTEPTTTAPPTTETSPETTTTVPTDTTVTGGTTTAPTTVPG